MADEMRVYRVSFQKVVRAIDRNMAQTIAAAQLRSEDPDTVIVTLVSVSTADRLHHNSRKSLIDAAKSFFS